MCADPVHFSFRVNSIVSAPDYLSTATGFPQLYFNTPAHSFSHYCSLSPQPIVNYMIAQPDPFPSAFLSFAGCTQLDIRPEIGSHSIGVLVD